MENRATTTANRQSYSDFYSTADGETKLAHQRLNSLLALNAQTQKEKALYRSEQERLEATLMQNPLSPVKAFAYFGLLLGTFPPAAIFTRFLANAASFTKEDSWVFGVILIINLLTAVVGYFSGKLIGKMVAEVENYSWWAMLLLLPFIGMFWGVMAGGAGGVIIFLFGALFGAAFGAMVGGVALPLFAVFHRLLKKGDTIDRKHFLPVAFGVTFTICAFILGL